MPTLTPSFDKTKTLAARWARTDFTPAGGVLVKISSKLLDVDSKLQTVLLKQPNATTSINHAVDEVAIEQDETITLVDIEEIDAVIAALGGLNGLVKGAADIYVRDPRDAAGVVKYKLPLANCSIKRPDGAIRMGGSDFSKTSLVVTNLSGSAIVPVVAGAAPDA